MAESLYSTMEFAQWRGPTTSDKYNERIENLYRDLVHLYNKVGLSEEGVRLALQRVIKDHAAISSLLVTLEQRIVALEIAANLVSFKTDSQIDTARFEETEFEVSSVDQLFSDYKHGLTTLPKVVSSSSSKIYFTNTDGESVLPSTFEARAIGLQSSADNSSATIDSSDLYAAFLPNNDVIWERNVITSAFDTDGAIIEVFVKLPLDLMMNFGSNVIEVSPFPIFGCELTKLEYSTKGEIVLSDTDNYQAFNAGENYESNSSAIGWIIPGGWTGDAIEYCGPKAFYFDPQDITAIKLTLTQKEYFIEDARYVYSYGLSGLDVRYDKFLDTGRAIIRFDAPGDSTISSVDNVLPQIWNVSPAELPEVFDYSVIWETAYNSGVYTTNPVAFSSRVWIDVTLNKTRNGGTPALSGLVVSCS